MAKTITPQAFIFMGRSGSGKGTQAQLLMKLLKERDSQHNILYLQTGQEFREFITGTSDTQKMSGQLMKIGKLQPEFLTVHMWAHILIEKYKTGDHIVCDGVARKYIEANALDSAFDFYGFKNPQVIYLAVDESEVYTRLSKRSRLDDAKDDIGRRMKWFEEDVMNAIEFYRKNPTYSFHEINGQQPIEAVHADIVKELGLV